MINAGLILEGGGMRGAYTAGVLDCLIDENIYFKDIYAVSAGSCHACSYISKQKERAIHTITDYLDDKSYAGLYSLLTTGEFFGVDLIYDIIPNKLIPFDYETFKNSPINLYAVLTNCNTGEAEYQLVSDLRRDMNLIKASSSLPSLSKIVTINKQPYLDGGISDSIPLAKSIADGNKKNVVVLTQHKGYKKGRNKLAPFISMIYRRYPKMTSAIASRHIRYNETLKLIEQGKKDGSVLVLQPKHPVEIRRLEKDKNKLWELYYQGYNDTKKRIPEIKNFTHSEESIGLKSIIKKIVSIFKK